MHVNAGAPTDWFVGAGGRSVHAPATPVELLREALPWAVAA